MIGKRARSPNRRTRKMHRRSNQRLRRSTLPCDIAACIVDDVVSYYATTTMLPLSSIKPNQNAVWLAA